MIIEIQIPGELSCYVVNTSTRIVRQVKTIRANGRKVMSTLTQRAKRESLLGIAMRMEMTGQTYQQVVDEIAMMQAAAERFRTGNLTKEDKVQMAECARHFMPQGHRRSS